MNRTCKLSHVTQAYLDIFYRILNTMIRDMTSVYLTNSISNNFINQMIPHHEGAVQMSHNVLRFNICPSLNPILNAIITSQCEGIRQMQQLLRHLDHC